MNTDVHGGPTTAGTSEHGAERRMSRGRLAAWAVAALFLLGNGIATAVTDEVRWGAGDLVLAAVLLFVPLGVYELVVRKGGNTAYRAGVGLALAATFLLVWSNAAVGITDSAADGGYLAALAVGVGGAFLARFEPRGMAAAMVATAVALVLVGMTALVAGLVPAQNAPVEVMGITAFFVALFGGSAWLFWEAAREGGAPGAA